MAMRSGRYGYQSTSLWSSIPGPKVRSNSLPNPEIQRSGDVLSIRLLKTSNSDHLQREYPHIVNPSEHSHILDFV